MTKSFTVLGPISRQKATWFQKIGNEEVLGPETIGQLMQFTISPHGGSPTICSLNPKHQLTWARYVVEFQSNQFLNVPSVFSEMDVAFQRMQQTEYRLIGKPTALSHVKSVVRLQSSTATCKFIVQYTANILQK